MKKNFFFALLSAIALTGTAGLSSCSSSEETAEVNPNYDPKTGEVLTQFVFNVSNGNQPTTRQSEDATQASSALQAADFRGIENAHILCFKNSDGDGHYIQSAVTAEKDFDMARVLNAGTISSDMSRRVLEMSLPLNTNSMVFYGRAVKNTDKNAYGDLENTNGTDGYNVSNNLSNVSFHLSKCLKSADKTKFEATQKLLAGILTCIMNTNRGTAEVKAIDTAGDDAYVFDIPSTTVPNMPWSSYVDASTGKLVEKSPVDTKVNLTELERKLAKIYKEMTQIQTAELRNTSGPALLATMKNLWSIVNSVRCATPTSLPEAVAKYMASRISAEINKYFACSSLPEDGGSVAGVGFIGAVSDLVTTFEADTYWPSGAGEKPASDTFTGISSVSASVLATFPENYNLPQGSTHVTFNTETKAFSYAVNYNSSAVGSTAFTVDDYYYPPELLYFGNSPIRVSDAEHVVSQYPESTTKWDTEASTNTTDSWYGWTPDSHVQSTTRSVAMRNDINYGTSLLKTTVGYAATTLFDNNKYIQNRDYGVTEENKAITPKATSFILKGILVGGQSPRVGWNFLPSLAEGERQGYVFDKAITSSGSIPATGSSNPNYTLVFDNYTTPTTPTTPTTQDKVYVALELQNNSGEDFFGKDNLIPNGSNFYLIGELDPSGKTISSWPTYHALPPYPYNSTNGSTVRVFIQDYMTEANFKIGQYSLQYAYLTVPDLRSSSVTLGLSVDVKWSTGLEFDNVIVGGDSQINVPTNP